MLLAHPVLLEIHHQHPRARGVLAEMVLVLVSINAAAAVVVLVLVAEMVFQVQMAVPEVMAPHLLFLGLQYPMLAAAQVRQPPMVLQALRVLVEGGLKLTEQPTLAAAAAGLALTAAHPHIRRFQAAPAS
jgi:hypothetical protein